MEAARAPPADPPPPDARHARWASREQRRQLVVCRENAAPCLRPETPIESRRPGFSSSVAGASPKPASSLRSTRQPVRPGASMRLTGVPSLSEVRATTSFALRCRACRAKPRPRSSGPPASAPPGIQELSVADHDERDPPDLLATRWATRKNRSTRLTLKAFSLQRLLEDIDGLYRTGLAKRRGKLGAAVSPTPADPPQAHPSVARRLRSRGGFR